MLLFLFKKQGVLGPSHFGKPFRGKQLTTENALVLVVAEPTDIREEYCEG